jgi:hypothetical protein
MRLSERRLMKRPSWLATLGALLVALSAVLYWLHYAIFRDAHHIFIYLLGDIAFLPLEVLLLTLIVHRLLGERERRLRLQKLNMVIGAFFSEVGTALLSALANADPELDAIRADLAADKGGAGDRLARLAGGLRGRSSKVDIGRTNLGELHGFLAEKRDFMLRLLENPNLLEHESFTDLLQSVFHLTEELARRESFVGLPASDYQHLAADIARVYSYLTSEWLDYMKHLEKSYPYLFSLAVRTNPFDRDASPIVR